VQTTSAAINPSVSMIGCVDQFNACAVALKLNAANGTLRKSGINLIRVCHFTTITYPVASASAIYTLQSPVVGNLRVLACDDPALSGTTAVTDNEGGVWTSVGTPGSSGIWWRANTVSNSDLCITIQGGGGDLRLSWRIYDIIGAAVAPFDNGAAVGGTVTAPTYTQSTSPTPTTGNGIVIANVGLGTGPGLAIVSPAGAAWLLCTYTGENDLDVIEDADLSACYYFTSNTVETWTWTVGASSSSSGGFAIFAAAPAAAQTPYNPWPLRAPILAQ
jgi:hypothetical protein